VCALIGTYAWKYELKGVVVVRNLEEGERALIERHLSNALLIDENNKAIARWILNNTIELLDNCIVALLIYKGLKIPEKLEERVKLAMGPLREIIGVDIAEELEKVLPLLSNRSLARISVSKLTEICSVVQRVFEGITGHLRAQGVIVEDLTENVRKLLEEEKKYEEEIGYVHEVKQSEAELLGEMGIGTKLGNKIANPSNFSQVYVLTNDIITREILNKNEEIARTLGNIYKSFLDIVETIRKERISGKTCPYKSTDFRLIIALEHRGKTIFEIVEEFRGILDKVLKETLKSSENNTEREN